jgi:type II secretory pathway pseudopilin PulG
MAMIAVMLTIATVLVPSMAGVQAFKRVEDAAQTLAVYERAIANFHLGVSVRPNALRQLTRQVVITDLNSCGETYKNQQLKNDGSVWAGPYLTRVVPSHGDLPLDIGIVKDTLMRNPLIAQNRNDPGELIIRILYVQENEARALDRRMDGGTPNETSGRVQWVGPADADGFLTVEYTIPVTGC